MTDKTEPMNTEDTPLEFCLNFEIIPQDKKQETIFLHKWYKPDGEWIEEGKPLYVIRMGSYFNSSIPFNIREVLSPKSGILQIHKKEKDIIKENEIIYSIHPSGRYEKENSILKPSYSFYFDMFKYPVKDEYRHHGFSIKEWHKDDGDIVKKGDLILTFGCKGFFEYKQTFPHYAEKDGYLDKAVRWAEHFVFGISQNYLIYIINDDDNDRINRKFNNIPDITIDDFTGKKIIKWKSVADGTRGVSSYCSDKKILFTFSFNNIDEKDYIIFRFESKELMLNKNDVISFLFSENKIIDFKIESVSYKTYHPNINKLFENKVQITDEELQSFEKLKFLKWKISSKKQNREIIGGDEGYGEYKSAKNLNLVINKLAKEYRELVKSEIPNYQPLLQRDTFSISLTDTITEECYVYLMIDINNQYHKIGISNNPEWREKTLQSEKPTIELIAAKKFVNRKIASSFEKALHNSYSEKRIRGEWFKLDLIDIQEIKTTLLT